MTGVAVGTNELKRNQAFAPTCRAIGRRSGGSSSTRGDWWPGTRAFAARPAERAIRPTTPNAAKAASGPAKGAGGEREEERPQEPLASRVEDARAVDRRDVAAGGGEERDRGPPGQPQRVEDAIGEDRRAGPGAGIPQPRAEGG